MRSRRPRIGWLLAALAVLGVAAAMSYVVMTRQAGLPAPTSEAYEQTTRRFFRGLAELQVGLLDAARDDFAAATSLAPGEPAAWANLGLAHLRLGEFDAAAPAIERAMALAPQDGAIALLLARLEISRGRPEQGIVQLRRVVELDPRDLRARSALAQEVENAGGADADADAQRILEDVFTRQPENVAVLVERARLSAKRADATRLRDSMSRLETFSAEWPPEVKGQYAEARRKSDALDFPGAAREVAFLRNTLAVVPAFQEGRRLVTPPAELIADPLTSFLRLPNPASAPSAADVNLRYAAEPVATTRSTAPAALVAISLDGDASPVVFGAYGSQIDRLDSAGASWPFPGGTAGGLLSAHALVALDWNNDFRMDLLTAGPGGVQLLMQGADGAFTDATEPESRAIGAPTFDATGVWAADIEMDGDLDAVVGIRDAPPVVLRNNGDGTWGLVRPFAGVAGLRAFAWGDVDGDGDPDAVLVDGHGDLRIFVNVQAGRFQPVPGPPRHSGLQSVVVGDLNADGVLDIVTLDDHGAISRASMAHGVWSQDAVATWSGQADGARARLIVEDFDNNGALDVLASGPGGTAIWLATDDHGWRALQQVVDAEVWSVADVTGDGQLDLIGVSGGRPVRLVAKGTLGYHAQVIRPRAQPAAGDQRINAFGLGGEVAVRSGRLVQKQIITGPAVHIGLGTRSSVDVTRIVWPNGVVQADFDTLSDRPVVEQQRLKGSCPWVFADDGTGMRFVTDFLWRSPLGLRINAQDTAGITQTEDWVKIRGDQLVDREGAYDVRITAELWETHFVDHASLLVVDHPDDTAMFVDERFARASPSLAVHAMRPPQAVARAWDQTGRDVTDLVSHRDGRYLDTFARGAYQGVAEDHFVEIDLGQQIPRDGSAWLVAEGWIYPTDSSINVAIGQGTRVTPSGLSLEALDARGRWVLVAPDLGFPAGKNKTILIDLGQVARAGVVGARRLRLRTNLEIYWDALSFATGTSDAAFRTVREAASRADLRYRGFSETRIGRTQPEVPAYDRIANTAPRWRDLVGYYTRFGDVRELLTRVDDRYVIMNAGDELRLSFPAPAPPLPGWTRDFVLIGDGWVKDGDFNTSFSKTVLPLPAHGHPTYEASSMTPSLDQDPVYRRHPADWQTFHTRFVTPDAFLNGFATLSAAGRP